MWQRHTSGPFPDSVDTSDDRWQHVDPVLVDADIAGLVSHVVGRSRLRYDQRQWLESSLRDLDYVLTNVSEPAASYFLLLQDMARLALTVDA